MVLKLLPLALMLSACIGSRAPEKLATATPITYAIWLETGDGEAAVPSAFPPYVEGELGERNLVPTRVTIADAPGTTQRRLEALARAAPDAPYLMIVEARATFFSQLSGRYRWDVDVRLTIADRTRLSDAMSSTVGVAAFLQYEHEREPEALMFVRRQVVDEVGALVDKFFDGRAAQSTTMVVQSPARVAQSDAIYFVMVDRFADGDPSNDGDADRADPDAFHGGDLRGLREHLDWIQGLGFGAVWVAPVFAMQTQKFFGHGAFHGYWTKDLRHIEPRFGGEAELVALADALRTRGMGLWLDFVANHVGYEAPLIEQHPDWFHRRDAIKNWDDPTELEQGQVHGLPDLDQDNPAVYRYLTDAARAWVDKLGLAGYRLDAVKHVPAAFWARFAHDLHADAPHLGLLGEVLDGDPATLARWAETGGFTALFDFALRYALVDVFCKGKDPAAIGVVMDLDRLWPSGVEQVTFLDNHDLPRIASECGGDMTKVAHAIDALLVLRGRPSLTWGTEVGLLGAGEPENRADMRFDADHPLVAHVRDGLVRRNNDVALRSGATTVADWSPGKLTLTRGGRWSITITPSSVDVVRTTATPRGAHGVAVTFRGQASERIAGSAPELGRWDPKLPANGTVTLPAGAVVAWKLVRPDKQSGWQWEQRDNRYLFVPWDKDALVIDAAWQS